MSASAGDEAVAALEIVGLLTRTGRGTVAAGPATLDGIAAARDTEGCARTASPATGPKGTSGTPGWLIASPRARKPLWTSTPVPRRPAP